MSFWDKVRSDLKKGLDGGVALLKEGSAQVVTSVDKIAEVGLKQFQLLEQKVKIQGYFTRLGKRIYELARVEGKDPLKDEKVQAAIKTIGAIEDQIGKLETETVKELEKPAKKEAAKDSVQSSAAPAGIKSQETKETPVAVRRKPGRRAVPTRAAAIRTRAPKPPVASTEDEAPVQKRTSRRSAAKAVDATASEPAKAAKADNTPETGPQAADTAKDTGTH